MHRPVTSVWILNAEYLLHPNFLAQACVCSCESGIQYCKFMFSDKVVLYREGIPTIHWMWESQSIMKDVSFVGYNSCKSWNGYLFVHWWQSHCLRNFAIQVGHIGHLSIIQFFQSFVSSNWNFEPGFMNLISSTLFIALLSMCCLSFMSSLNLDTRISDGRHKILKLLDSSSRWKISEKKSMSSINP